MPKILIIEDEKPLQRALVDKFNRRGFTTLKANNGLEGLNLLQEHLPDIILLDIFMPVMGGLNFLNKINEDKTLRGIPIFVLSNSDENKIIISASLKGCDDYLNKSKYSLSDIVDKVERKLKTIR